MQPGEFKMPFGRREDNRFRGLPLNEIARLPGGLVWLDEIAKWIDNKHVEKWRDVERNIRAFLDTPEVAKVLKCELDAAKEQRKQRTIARNRQRYSDRTLGAELRGANADRGF